MMKDYLEHILKGWESVSILIKNFIKATLYYTGIIDILHYLITSKIKLAVILRYHSVADFKKDDFGYAMPQIIVSTKNFEKHIKYLSKRYNIIPLEEIILYLKGGKDLPENLLAITFDDGYRDNYLNAYPILKKYGATATFFLTAGCIGNKEMFWTHKLIYLFNLTKVKDIKIGKELYRIDGIKNKQQVIKMCITFIKDNINQRQKDRFIEGLAKELGVKSYPKIDNTMLLWEDAIELDRAGFGIGSHTVTHPNLPNSDDEYAEYEIKESKNIIEEKLSKTINLFAYPNGGTLAHFNEYIKTVVKDAGFIGAVTSIDGLISKRSDIYELKRKGVGDNMRLCLLATELVIDKIKERFLIKRKGKS